MEEEYEDNEDEKEHKIKYLRERSKRVKHRRHHPKHDEEIYDALKEGRKEANDEVYGDDESTADKVESAE